MSDCRSARSKNLKVKQELNNELPLIIYNETFKILLMLIPILVSVALIVWFDRRVWGFVQKRRGPNVVGPFGLFQTLADALKYIFKEIIIPASSNKVVFILAPISNNDFGLISLGSNSPK